MSDRVAESAEQIGRGIRKLRKQRRWKQDVLAQGSGISRVTISLAENAKTNLSLFDLERVAMALNTSVTGLIVAGRDSLRISDEELKSIVANNLKRRRLHLGLSRAQLADKAGFLQQYISTTENARRLPTIRNLIRIAEALEISTTALFSPTFSPDKSYGSLVSIDVDVIGIRLKEARESRSLNKQIVARISGFAPQQIGRFESGRVIPTLPTLFELCRAIGVTPDVILE